MDMKFKILLILLLGHFSFSLNAADADSDLTQMPDKKGVLQVLKNNELTHFAEESNFAQEIAGKKLNAQGLENQWKKSSAEYDEINLRGHRPTALLRLVSLVTQKNGVIEDLLKRKSKL